jgi:hypothetical protein
MMVSISIHLLLHCTRVLQTCLTSRGQSAGDADNTQGPEPTLSSGDAGVTFADTGPAHRCGISTARRARTAPPHWAFALTTRIPTPTTIRPQFTHTAFQIPALRGGAGSGIWDRVRERFPIMVNTIDGTSSSLSEILASGSSRFPARGR